MKKQENIKESGIKVSIAMITYNHGDFIAQALESILEQDVDFDYEIVIGDDASTDNTAEIVRDYAARYPDRIHAIVGLPNVGMHRNLERVVEACQGKYIALLEGDDFWTNKNKLQKQVNIMDARPEVSLVFHPVLYQYDSSNNMLETPLVGGASGIVSLETLVEGNYINTCSVMFRHSLFTTYPEWWHELKLADWLLFLDLASKGEIVFLKDQMAAYRVHTGGVWSHTSAKSMDFAMAQAQKRFFEMFSGSKEQKRRIKNRYSGPIAYYINSTLDNKAGNSVYKTVCLLGPFMSYVPTMIFYRTRVKLGYIRRKLLGSKL